MRAINPLSHIAADTRGTAVTEFVVVAPLFLAIFIGILEISLQFYFAAAAEKAVQVGARTAVVVTPPAGVPAINDRDVNAGGTWGDVCAPTSDPCQSFAAVECTGTGCTGGVALVIARMQAIFPAVQASNIRLRYEYVHLGFAGGPTTPAVTVTITGLNWPAGPFAAAMGLLGGTGFTATMPNIRATLTGEDLAT